MKHPKILVAALFLGIIFFLFHTLFGQIILWNAFLNPVSEIVYTVRCKIIDKEGMMNEVASQRLNEKFVFPCAKSRWWMDDRNFAIELVTHHGSAILSLPLELREDREIMIAAILSGANLDFGAYANDKDFVMTAVRKNGQLFKFASDELKNDSEAYHSAFGNYIWALEFAGPKLKNDAGIVTEAIGRDWWNFRYASDKLKDNREMALKAIWSKRLNFDYLSERLKADPEIRKIAKLRDGEYSIGTKISPSIIK